MSVSDEYNTLTLPVGVFIMDFILELVGLYF